MSFLGRDESNFSQEKVLMKRVHHHQYTIMMTKIMGNMEAKYQPSMCYALGSPNIVFYGSSLWKNETTYLKHSFL
jgi:hypothetical protein